MKQVLLEYLSKKSEELRLLSDYNQLSQVYNVYSYEIVKTLGLMLKFGLFEKNKNLNDNVKEKVKKKLDLKSLFETVK